MPGRDRREGFRLLYQFKGKEEMSKDPHAMIGLMKDLGFDRADINMVWYLSRNEPGMLSRFISGDYEDLKSAVMETAARTSLDADRLLALVQDMAGS